MSAPAISPLLLRQPPAELVSFVERHIHDVEPYEGRERRSEKRYLMVLPVTAQRIGQRDAPMGEPFAMVTRDISPQGIGLVHAEPIDQGLLALQMSLADEEMNLVVEVQSCEAFGPFYYLGGRFLKNSRSFPQPGEPK